MLNIIKSDFYKMVKSKSFWICVLICVGFAFLSVGVYQSVINNALTDPNHSEHANMIKMAPLVSGAWTLEFFVSMAFQFLIVGIFIATFLSPEFSHGTMKNALTRGVNRVKVFLSKFLVCSCVSVLMTLMYILALLFAGTVVWGFDPNGIFSLTGLINALALQSLLAISFAALYTFISFSIRSYGIAMATIIMSVIMGGKIMGAVGAIIGMEHLDSFWLEWGVSSMATYAPASSDITQSIIVALGWGIVSIIAGSALFKKFDVQ
jgi:ABC-2 type transport system permease protein